MTDIVESAEHEASVEELLMNIIDRLDVLILHNEIITDDRITEEDLGNVIK